MQPHRFIARQLRFLLYRRRISARRIQSKNRSNYPRSEHAINWRLSLLKLLEGGVTAFGLVMVLGVAGCVYPRYYKSVVLSKMQSAFVSGYSTLESAALRRHVVDLDQDFASEPL
ncbi:hypothetical protein BJ166DRAFT_240552 [Pestalotiopsis sp. NC0098]|nr:hypothetical protein BJ166DRAFT_240552 [Pestalotiopsis sp. NC0098]